MFERRLYFYVDWWLLGAVLILCALGVMMIYGTTYNPTTEKVGTQFYTQLYALAIAVVAFVICLSIDYRTLSNYSLFIYVGVVGLLIYALFFGVEAGGARRWISFGPFNLQPSEFAKIGLALVLAIFFAENRRGTTTIGDLLIGMGFVAVPAVLIAREPDLGTAVTLVIVSLGIMYVIDLRVRVLAVLAGLLTLIVIVTWAYALADYQRSRIFTFFDPARDELGAGYQQIQARVTVGSGGLTGKGFLQGTQGQYKFLPVAHNDFIFSVLAEEQGFLGVLVALSLYLFVIVRGFDAARLSKDRLGLYLVMGIMAPFSFQVIYNITMSAGLAPVKGLPLPLMSYGGSSIIATLVGFGLVLNVRMRRYAN